MSALAEVDQLPTGNERLKLSRKRISLRMQQALNHLATKGVNQRQAAKLAGISEYHLSRQLRNPQIQVFIAQRARQNMQIGVLRASNRVLELIDAESEHVGLDASKHVLAIEGIKPRADAQVSVNIDIKAGYVIDLTDEARRPVQHIGTTIEHEVGSSD
jgi:hypothetical protein